MRIFDINLRKPIPLCKNPPSGGFYTPLPTGVRIHKVLKNIKNGLKFVKNHRFFINFRYIFTLFFNTSPQFVGWCKNIEDFWKFKIIIQNRTFLLSRCLSEILKFTIQKYRFLVLEVSKNTSFWRFLKPPEPHPEGYPRWLKVDAYLSISEPFLMGWNNFISKISKKFRKNTAIPSLDSWYFWPWTFFKKPIFFEKSTFFDKNALFL